MPEVGPAAPARGLFEIDPPERGDVAVRTFEHGRDRVLCRPRQRFERHLAERVAEIRSHPRHHACRVRTDVAIALVLVQAGKLPQRPQRQQSHGRPWHAVPRDA